VRTDGTADATSEGDDTVAGGTVLMVDDEVAVRVPAGERLRDLGYHVVEAPDGPSALRMLDEGLRPDLLVSDVGLPNGMDGRAVAEAARRRLPGLPVLFMTGYARVVLPDDAAVITKPFDLQALAARVKQLLKD
jgi:CheY-like chemotaxis protein